ncbi:MULTISPECIES: fatty acid desaturase [Sorangium]|uniref:Fatty acid desaturase n=1 Tax=Sorangium atrum TaxID=2995308 RepID=A0ABT5CGS6_9BACT|nr:fatty acid desaturase [Sorangium aterium]MDC0685637.1 fatty acid desaturase [Sorangium aterium]
MRSVAWRDLCHLTPRQIASELLLPLPWLIGSLVACRAGWFIAAGVCWFFFFLTGLRVVHGAQHYSLGLPRWAQDTVLLVLSVLMAASMHAIQATHWQHHRACLDETDVEARPARLSWWRALVSGPMFILTLHVRGAMLARRRQRWWIAAEILLIAALLASAAFGPWVLRVHVMAMLAGECATGFFAVWTVHRGCDGAGHVARTQRGRWKPVLAYSMFYHREHHWFPQVPTPHLRELARRLDAVAPVAAEHEVY